METQTKTIRGHEVTRIDAITFQVVQGKHVKSYREVKVDYKNSECYWNYTISNWNAKKEIETYLLKQS